MRRTTLHLGLAALALAAIALAGCAGGEGTKAGGSGAPVTLRIGTNDPPGRPVSDQIEEFARRAEQLSGGKIRVEPVWQAAGNNPDDWDQQVARLVVGGELDLGLIPSRTWDTEGVTSLRALNAPFLVTSDELLDRVVTSRLADRMLAGLDQAGVVGLALFPDSLHHPFGVGEPVLSLNDYAGALVRAPRSDVVYDVFEALGARADDLAEGAEDRALADGSLTAVETSFTGTSWLGYEVIATGNVTLFPKVNSLVVNADVFGDLDEQQRTILEQAAARTLEWAIDATPTDAQAAQAYCDHGGTVVHASEADVAALEQAASPVYAELERDAQTKSLIEAIRALGSEVGVSATSTPAPCGRSGAGIGTALAGPPEQSIPNGVYRSKLTEEELVQAGMDSAVADEYSGLHTITLENGKLVDELVNENYTIPTCLGSYLSTGSTVEVSFEVECQGGMTAKWTLEKGVLRFTDIKGTLTGETDLVGPVFGTKPFKKIG